MDRVVEKQMGDGTLSLIGYDVVYHNFAAVPYVSEQARDAMLNSVHELLQKTLQPTPV